MTRTCLNCQKPVFGRADKKFCSDSCRNSYHNKSGKQSNNLMRRMNRSLARNRQILAELNPKGKAKTTREILITYGFNFDLYTSIYETRKGGRYYFCYDQGYIFLENNEVALVVRYEDLGRKRPLGKQSS